MAESWLQSNRRALRVALVVPGALTLVGLLLAISGLSRGIASFYFLFGAGLLVVGIFGAAWLIFAMRVPRLGYEDGELLVYLRSLTPLRVPIDVVECFFLGQGPARPAPPDVCVPKAANVIVRLAESATDYHAREVRSDLGIWNDGYITIRGMWCEPLSHERVNELNRKLSAAQRALRQHQEAT